MLLLSFRFFSILVFKRFGVFCYSLPLARVFIRLIDPASIPVSLVVWATSCIILLHPLGEFTSFTFIWNTWAESYSVGSFGLASPILLSVIRFTLFIEVGMDSRFSYEPWLCKFVGISTLIVIPLWFRGYVSEITSSELFIIVIDSWSSGTLLTFPLAINAASTSCTVGSKKWLMPISGALALR